MVVDPAPPDAGTDGSGGMGALEIENDPALPKTKLRLIDQWFDTSPKTTVRTVDLPLFDPPRLKLSARREGDRVHVQLEGASVPVSTRWEADGDVNGNGLEASWRPSGEADRVRVAIRSRGGVAVLSLRADEATDVG